MQTRMERMKAYCKAYKRDAERNYALAVLHYFAESGTQPERKAYNLTVHAAYAIYLEISRLYHAMNC